MESEILMEPPEMEHVPHNQEKEEEMDLTAPASIAVSPPQPESIVNESIANVAETIPMFDIAERRKRSYSPSGESPSQIASKKKRKLRINNDDSMDQEIDDELAFL